MKLNPETLEDTSLHYYVPAPGELHGVLYYPISIGYFDCKPAYAVHRNIHKSYLLIVMMEGMLNYQTHRQRGTLRVGQALLLDCKQPHSYQALGKCSFTFIHFDGAQSREICEQINRTSGNCIRLTDSTRMHELVGELLSFMKDEHRVNEAQTSAMLYSILMVLMESSGVSGAGNIGNSIVDQAIAFIQHHLSETLTVETIAASVGYSQLLFPCVSSRNGHISLSLRDEKPHGQRDAAIADHPFVRAGHRVSGGLQQRGQLLLRIPQGKGAFPARMQKAAHVSTSVYYHGESKCFIEMQCIKYRKTTQSEAF